MMIIGVTEVRHEGLAGGAPRGYVGSDREQ